VVQAGTLAEVTAHPRSRYVAQLIGVNLVRGVVSGEVFTTADGQDIVVADAAGGQSFASIRPQSIALHRERPHGTPRNTWPVTIIDIDLLGDRARIGLDGPVPLTAEVTASAVVELGLRPGDAVFAVVKATEIETYPA
jgi:molybdate transport system ATP-binding protein